MPGTGKSTVSQFIHRQLQASGRQSFWCHEESDPHPVRLFYDRERHRSWTQYCDEAESIWRDFVEKVLSDDLFLVLDAAVLQNHVRSMMIFNCDRSAIFGLMRTIGRVLDSLTPQLIYLKPRNIEQNFRDVVDVRGERMLELWLEFQKRFPCSQKYPEGGLAGFIAFWKEFDEIADCVFGELPISKLKLEVSNYDWDARFRKILAFLELPLPSDVAPSPALERYVGKYVSVCDPDLEFRIDIREGSLIATVERPTIDVGQGPIGCFREARLIPDAVNRFSVAAWPHVIEFTEVRKGEISGLRLSVSAIGWQDSERVYVRQ